MIKQESIEWKNSIVLVQKSPINPSFGLKNLKGL